MTTHDYVGIIIVVVVFTVLVTGIVAALVSVYPGNDRARAAILVLCWPITLPIAAFRHIRAWINEGQPQQAKAPATVSDPSVRVVTRYQIRPPVRLWVAVLVLILAGTVAGYFGAWVAVHSAPATSPGRTL